MFRKIKLLVKRKPIILTLFGIFIIAVTLRFLYFQKNTYFAYDQARDAYAAKEVMMGDLKIIGPPATFKGVFHGPLYYYLTGPIYFLSKGSPEVLSAFVRIFNALGVFLVFLIARNIFNKRIAIVSAFLYAISFEQSQYALFLGHPSLAVISVLVFYWGLSLLLFQKNSKGLPLIFVGLGLSIQFHFSSIYLILPLLLLLIIQRRRLPRLDLKIIIISLMGFIGTILTFIIAEIKFNFRTIRALGAFFEGSAGSGSINLKNLIFISTRYFNDNVIANKGLIPVAALLILMIYLKLFLDEKTKDKAIFLLIWFVAGLTLYLLDFTGSPTYYYSIGASISLIVITAVLIDSAFNKSRLIGYLLILIIYISNISLIAKINPTGTLPEVNAQEKMLVSDEKKVIDYIYQHAEGKPFAVNALSIPYKINTTWSYLFEWYGQRKYGYLPVWGGDAAEGFYGNLTVVTARSQLPEKWYLIIEPTRGLSSELIEEFMNEEDYFSSTREEKRFGDFTIQVRIPTNL